MSLSLQFLPFWGILRTFNFLIACAKVDIPKGFCKEYIPCWNEETDRLYEEFRENHNPDVAKKLLLSSDEARKQAWISTVSKVDLKHSSRKAWILLKKLGVAKPPAATKPLINPNHIAAQIVNFHNAKCDKEFTRTVNRARKKRRAKLPQFLVILENVHYYRNR